MKKRILAFCMCVLLLGFWCTLQETAHAKGADYTVLEDVYYTKADCKLYAEPTYTATVLTTVDANVPVRVVGYYSNGWYRINVGVIAYCKMDSLTTAGDVGVITATDKQAIAAKQIADSLGYQFHYLKLNEKKVIKKDIFNSYIDEKAILFARIDDDIAVLFKMVYPDKVTSDINLNFTKTLTENADGSRTMNFDAAKYTELIGQIAIFQVKTGYDKAVDINVMDWQSPGSMNLMNTYYTEYEEFAYAPVTQIADMSFTEAEVTYSLDDDWRAVMSDLKKGIKYQSDDTKAYRSAIPSKLRKDTEYIDYIYQ